MLDPQKFDPSDAWKWIVKTIERLKDKHKRLSFSSSDKNRNGIKKLGLLRVYVILDSSLSIYKYLYLTGLNYDSSPLKLVNLFFRVSQLLQDTSQLTLIRRRNLWTRDSLVHSWWTTDKDLNILGLRFWKNSLQELLVDESLSARP